METVSQYIEGVIARPHKMLKWGCCAACEGTGKDIMTKQNQCRFCRGKGEWNRAALSAVNYLRGDRLKQYNRI